MRGARLWELSFLCVVVVILSFPVQGRAQGSVGGGPGERGRIEGRYKIIPIPYVSYNRSIGGTFGALPLVMFNPVARDTVSPSSIAGALAMYSTNKTWFVVGFARVHLAEDNWRLTGAGGFGSVNFQFYLDNPINIWIPYNTRAGFAYAQLERRIVGRLYGGASYIYTRFRNTTELAPDTTVTTTLNGFGLSASMDLRSNVYYPRTGFFTNVKYFGYPKAFGNDFESNTVDLDYNHYWSVRDRTDVVAARAFVGLGLGDLAFNQQYVVGRRSDLRGYTQGAHRGNYLVAVQGEYRWNFWKRLGAVGFAGVATVFESINEADDGRLLPGVGAGIRFTAFTDNHMNVGFDAAVGDGDWGIYFRIGEAF
ncbi:MAG: BamA/TamA family outer membrane protein [Gemmatimonadales bacterium]|jgi:outer membrane protein assembly factor BamA